MKWRDRIGAFFCFFLGLAVLVRGFDLGLKVKMELGPGFFPVVVGGILCLLSLAFLLRSWIRKDGSLPRKSFWSRPHGWKPFLLTLGVLSAYPLILKPVGFLLSTFFLLFILLGKIARLQWLWAGVGGVVATLVVYLVFEVWLRGNLPRGILSF